MNEGGRSETSRMPREEGPKACSNVSNVTESYFALVDGMMVWVEMD